jgi:hypothetical protein
MSRRTSATLAACILMSALPGLASASSGAGSVRSEHAPPPCSAEKGQLLIDEGRYQQAVREFTCVIAAHPTEVEGYRGRIEAELLLGLYSDAVRDYARVTAFVEPLHPDAASIIFAGYDARLAADPDDVAALTGSSFARWWFFAYSHAIQILDADIAHALALAPGSPHVHYVVADACLYGRADHDCALGHAAVALDGGLDTPRVHAILAASFSAFGDLPASGVHTERHIELVTTELVTAPALAQRSSLSLALVPGRTYLIPVPAVAGQTLSISTRSSELFDSIVALFGPDGSPLLGSDDARNYFAEFKWPVQVTGTHWLWATSFEGVGTGTLVVARR